MIRIVSDGELIYSPNLVERGFVVYDPKLKLGFGKADVLTFVLPPNSQGYNRIHNLSSTVVVYDDNAIRFVGRALKVERDFYNNRSVYCEGGIAWLNDSVQEPFDFQDTSSSGYANFWNRILTTHNSQVSANRQFAIVAPDFQSPYTRSVDDYTSTYDLCLELCKDSGAAMALSYSESNGVITTSIALKKNWPRGDQKIKFGKNLLDIEEHIVAQDVYTVALPVGADNLTISSVNSGSPYLESSTGIAAFGRIVRMVPYTSVGDASALKAKAQTDLDNAVKEALTLKFDAVDLKRAGYNTDTILPGNWYHVESPPHSLDDWYQCSAVELDLVDPSKSKYAFGAELTGGAVISVATAKATERAQELAEKAESGATSAQTSANTALNYSEQLVLDDSTIADDYNRYLSRVGDVNRVFIAHASYWLDTPDSRSGVFTTQRYSTNYALQTFVSADGACDMWHRIVRIDGSEVDPWVRLATTDTSVVTASNTVAGLTVVLTYLKSAPNVMRLRISGTTTSQLNTASGWANLWNANTFLTNAIGSRSTPLIKYVVSGIYEIQLYIETSGLLGIGYASTLSTGTAVNIPSGTTLRINETIFLT